MYKLVNDEIIQNAGTRKNRYAIYLAPNINKNSHLFLKKCNKIWGGMHITIVGFHNNHPPLKANTKKASILIPRIYKKKN